MEASNIIGKEIIVKIVGVREQAFNFVVEIPFFRFGIEISKLKKIWQKARTRVGLQHVASISYRMRKY